MTAKNTLSLLLAAALLSSCTTVKTASTGSDDKNTRYANYATGAEAAPPAEGPEADIPSQGPPDVNTNPAYIPTPLLRESAAAGP